MKFDARTDSSSEEKEAFVGWLTVETVSTLRRAANVPESLKTAAFLFMNRGREAGLLDSEIAEVLGVSIARAGLSKEDEDQILEWTEVFDELLSAVHAEQRPWWKFWA